MIKELLDRILHEKLALFDSVNGTSLTDGLYKGTKQLEDDDIAVVKTLNNYLGQIECYKKQPEFDGLKDIIDDVIKSVKINNLKTQGQNNLGTGRDYMLAGLSYKMG